MYSDAAPGTGAGKTKPVGPHTFAARFIILLERDCKAYSDSETVESSPFIWRHPLATLLAVCVQG